MLGPVSKQSSSALREMGDVEISGYKYNTSSPAPLRRTSTRSQTSSSSPVVGISSIQTRSGWDQDEGSLLRVKEKRPDDAVTISRPVQRSGQTNIMTYGKRSRGLGGSIRPLNNLGTSPCTTLYSTKTYSSIPSMVPQKGKLFNLSKDRPTKRQKTDHSDDVSENGPEDSVITIVDDDEARGMLKNPKFATSPLEIEGISPRRPAQRRISNYGSPNGFGRATEYDSVEQMVRPRVKQGKPAWDSDGTWNMMDTSPQRIGLTRGVDLSSSFVTRTRANGSPRVHIKILESPQKRSVAASPTKNHSDVLITGEKSHYFAPKDPEDLTISGSNERESEQSVAVDPRRSLRTSHVANNAVSSEKTVISDSEDTDSFGRLTQSEGQIKSSQFKTTKSSDGRSAIKRKSSKQNRSFRLKSIMNRNFESADGPEVVLLPQDDGSFYPSGIPDAVLRRNQNFIIRPERAHAILFCADSSELVRVDNSRGHSSEDQFVFLRFFNGSDGYAFIQSVHGRNDTIVVRDMPKERITRIFDKALAENLAWAERSERLRSRQPDEIPDDIQLMRSNKRRLEEASTPIRVAESPQEEEQVSQRRMSTRKSSLFTKPASFETVMKGREASETFGRKTNDISTPQVRVSRRRPSPTPAPVFKFSKVTGLGDRWRNPLVYPATGRDRATVEFEDLARLDDEEWLNDNLIMFYLKYLENTIQPDSHAKVYIFNTYFHKQLTDTKGLPKGSLINYEKVQKWIKIDIFDYDYLIVPICANSHWWMAVICNLPTMIVNNNLFSNDAVSSAQALDDKPETVSEAREQPSKPVELIETDEEIKGSTEGVANLSINGKFEEDPSAQSTKNVEEQDETKEDGTLKNDSELKDELLLSSQEISSSKVMTIPDSPTNTSSPTRLRSPKSRMGGKKAGRPLKKYDPNVPILISFDSLGIARSTELRPLKEFIIEEGKSKRTLSIEREQLSGMTATQIPHQPTMSDCGVYLLGYVAKILRSPRETITKILTRTLSQDLDWPNFEASNLRWDIRKAAQSTYEQQERSTKLAKRRKTMADSSEKAPAASSAEVVDQGKVVDQEQGPAGSEWGRQEDGFDGENLEVPASAVEAKNSSKDEPTAINPSQTSATAHDSTNVVLNAIAEPSEDKETRKATTDIEEFQDDLLLTPPALPARPVLEVPSSQLTDT